MTIDELFNLAQSRAAENVQFVIDENLRIISVPQTAAVFGVEYDKDVNTVGFMINRYYSEVDLSEFAIRVSFENANNEMDFFDATDIVADESTVTFSWTMGASAFKYQGTIHFAVNFIKADADGTVQQAYNTTIAEGQCLVGLNVNSADVPESDYSDLIIHIQQQIQLAGNTAVLQVRSEGTAQTTAVTNAGTAQVQAVNSAGTTQVQAVKDAETEALGNIAAAAPALPAVSAAAAWQSVTAKPDGTGYNLAAMAPIEATIRPTVTGNPAVCEDSAAWAFQGLAIYGKSTQDGTPSPETPVPIVSAGADGSIDLAVSNGASLLQSMTISTPNGLPGIPVDSGGNYTDASGQQWISDKITESKKIHFLRYLDNSNYDTMIFNTAFSNDSVSICYIPPLYGIVKKFHAAIMSNMFIQGGHGGALLTVGEMSLEANGSVYFGLPPTVKSSLDAQNYMKTNSVKVLVQLAVPTETSLSVEELAAYRALHTYDGTTVVSTAEPVAGIEASYVMDGNKYRESVDKRLAALEAAQTGI